MLAYSNHFSNSKFSIRSQQRGEEKVRKLVWVVAKDKWFGGVGEGWKEEESKILKNN